MFTFYTLLTWQQDWSAGLRLHLHPYMDVDADNVDVYYHQGRWRCESYKYKIDYYIFQDVEWDTMAHISAQDF